WTSAPGCRGEQEQEPDGRGGGDGRVPAVVHRAARARARRTQGLRAELEQAMKLVSFRVQTPVGSFVRVGALHGHSIVDLNMACTRLLADQGEAQPARLAHAMVPATMLELLEGG